MSKKLIAGSVLALALFAFSSTEAATTVKYGMRSADVTALQTALKVTPTTGYFGKITLAAVKAFQTAHNLKADGVVGPMTWAAINASTVTTPTTGTTTPTTGTTPSTTLNGGAGTIDVTSTSTDVEDQVNEGQSNTKVLGFKLAADGSDVSVSNLKVTLKNLDSTSSYRIDRYAKSVSVWMGSTKVGSADVSDFTKDGTKYYKSISLSNAVVKMGTSNKATFYITVDANSSIDSVDMKTDNWAILVDSIRYTDATGVVMSSSESAGSITTGQFDFAALADSSDVKATVSKGSSSPVAQNIKVSDTGSTKDVLMLEFKVKATGTDVSFDTLNITNATASGTTAITTVISELQLKNGSSTLATIDGSDLAASNTFNLDDTFTVSKDTTETFRIYATVNDYDNFKANGGSVKVSLTGTGLSSAEDVNGDKVNTSGSANGDYQTFVLNAPIYSVVSKSLALNQSIDGVATGQEDIFLAKFVFNVTAGDDDIYLPRAITTTAGASATSFATFSHTGAGAVTGATVEADNSTLDDGLTNTYLISSGSTEKFTISYYVRGNDSTDKFTITGFNYDLSDVATATKSVTTGLTNFETSSVYLAK